MKGKKAWRKQIDITDVEEHQEEMRKDEIAGYFCDSIGLALYGNSGAVSERPDQDLFVIDTTGDIESTYLFMD